ncbi:MAG: TetR/AcrR family transcriptional regulator [Alphaproteobacteria bacterium]
MAHSQEETRNKILEETEKLYRHYGYAKTTISDISEACGMSSANIYRFFPSKSALTEAICSNVIHGIEQRLSEVANSPGTASERLLKFIQVMYQVTLENLLDNRKVHELVVFAMTEQWLTLRTHLEHIEELYAVIIKDGVETGEFPPCDVARAAKTVQAAAVTLCHPEVVAMKLDDDDRATPEEIAALIINALKHRATEL